MNILDVVFVTTLGISAFVGMRIGLIQASLNAIFVFVGLGFAGKVAEILGDVTSQSLSNDTIVTSASYAIIVVGALISTSIVSRIMKPMLTIFTFGLSNMIDRIGGLSLGLLIGLAVSLSMLIGGARLTYDFDPNTLVDQLPGGETVGTPLIPRVERARNSLEKLFTTSQMVPILISIIDTVPANMLGFVPEEFGQALEIVESARASPGQLQPN